MANEGIYGSETRAEVQNPLSKNLGQRLQPNTIPLTGVQTPRQANFSQVGDGQRVISKLLGDTAGVLDQYVEKNRKEWELEGRMAYAQGVAEEELYKTGNKYNMAGFLSMKVQTEGQQFYQQALSDINAADREKDPEMYRKEQMQKYNAFTQTLGDDPFISRLVAAQASEMFPKLAAQHAQSHNAWKKEQTELAVRDNVFTRATMVDPQSPNGGESPDTLRSLADPARSGLPLEDHKKMVIDVIDMTLERHDFRWVNALTGVDKKDSGTSVRDLPPTKVLADSTLGTIMKNELHADGVVRVHQDGAGKAIGGINSEAYPEQFAEASRILRDSGQVAALEYIRGFYQKEIIEKNGVQNLSADVQDVVADGLVNHWSGFQKELLDAAKAGTSRQDLIRMRQNEYMRLAQADPAKYGPSLEGWTKRLNSLQTAALQADSIKDSAQGFLTEHALVATLQQNGFSVPQITRAVNSYRKALVDKESGFDKNRYVNEQSLLNTAEKEGNLPAQLDAIKAMQITNGYSDKWADNMAKRVIPAIESNAKKQQELQDITTALNNGELGLQDPSKQKIGVDMLRASVIGRVNAIEGLTDAQKEQVIRQDMTAALSRNGVVDPLWERTINVGLTGEIVTKDGNANPKALKAYEDIQYLRKNSPGGYAERYMSASTAKLVAQIEAFDATMNSDQALVAAYNIQAQNQKDAGTPVTSSRKEEFSVVPDIIAEKVSEELDTGFLASFSRSSATTFLDVTDEDIAWFKTDPALISYVSVVARNILMNPANKHTTVKAAVNEAWTKVARNNVELSPGGNALIAPDDGAGTIRARIGAPNAGASNFVFKVLQQYQAENGKRLFGPRYVASVSYNTKEQVDAYKAANPNADFGSGSGISLYPDRQRSHWRATSEGLVWELLHQTEDGSWIGDGDFKVIPYDVINGFRRSKQFEQLQ